MKIFTGSTSTTTAATNKKAGYSSIPDVDDEEQGLHHHDHDHVTSSPPAPTLTLAEKYPEANDQERAFLGALDSAIERCSQPRVNLPTFHVANMNTDGPPDSPRAFLESLKYPTLALIASLMAATGIIITNSPIYKFLFPYVSCIVAFIATIPPIRQRFVTQSNLILTKIKSQKQIIESNVTAISTNAISYIDTAESFMDAALAPIKSKLDQVTELENALRIIDPNIDIPDVSDIEEAFDGCTDKIRNVIGMVLAAVEYSTTRAVPKTFQSQKSLDKSIFYPLLGVLLCIQLFGVWASSHAAANGDVGADGGGYGYSDGGVDVDGQGASSYVRGGLDTTTTTAAVTAESLDTTMSMSDNNTTTTVMEDDFVDTTTAELDLMLVSIQTYVTTMVQLIIAYIASNIAAITKKVNALIKSIENDVNDTLDKNVGETFKVVFEEGLGGVRAKTLKLIQDVEKIEGPLKKAQEMRDYKLKMAALKEKAMAEAEARAREAEAKAREAAERAKAEAEQKLREAKEEAERKAQEMKNKFFRKSAQLKEKAKAEAERKAQEAKEEAERKAQEAKEEAERKVREAKEEAERKARELEEQARAEAERRMEEAKEEALRKAEELRVEAERKIQEAKEEALRKKEEAEKRAAQANALMKGFGKKGGFGFK